MAVPIRCGLRRFTDNVCDMGCWRLPPFRLGSGLALLAAFGLVAGLSAQVAPLAHPTVEMRAARLGVSPDDGYRFVVFGDQKGLWKDDFPRVIEQVRAEADRAGAPPLLFMIDSGDIVDDGSKPPQFADLAEQLAPVRDLPYLVGVGNHELKTDKGAGTAARGRRNTAAFLGADYTVDRMFYATEIGPVRFLFLDTNELGVYPDLPGKDPDAPARIRAQLEWLQRELTDTSRPTVAVSHHAFVQSAKKHRDHAVTLWNLVHPELGGRTLAQALHDGGVDLVLTGHVHSYEVFALERADRPMWSLNASGKPTGSWFRLPGQRMPNDWRGREMARLKDAGFETGVDEWRVRQLAFMTDDTKRNQYALVTVSTTGSMHVELRAIDGAVLHVLDIP